jgi:phage N-6-adenine-methyltransferase
MQENMMTSNRDDWETPVELYNILDNIFHFSLDAAASIHNTKAEYFFTENDDALKQDWDLTVKSLKKTSTVFINPPYNNKGILLKFFNKIKIEADKGLTIVALVAARTETKWHKIAWDYARYFLFFYKRIKFELNGKSLGTPTFPSELIIFSKKDWDLSSLSSIAKILPNPIIKENV